MNHSKITVIIPTTGGPNKIEKITARPTLSKSFALAIGDYVPLDISPRYNDLVSDHGPLSEEINLGRGPFELRLETSFDTGRSWELPVALAHWVFQRDGELSNQEPDILIWATGSLGANLNILPQDYQLSQKLKLSKKIIQAHIKRGAKIKFFVPEKDYDDFKDELVQALPDGSHEVYPVSSLQSATSKLDVNKKPKSETKQKTTKLKTIIGFFLVILAFTAAFYVLQSEKHESLGKPGSVSSKSGETSEVQKTNKNITAPTLSIIEIRAEEDSSCAKVIVQGTGIKDVELKTLDGKSFLSSEAGLCGLKFEIKNLQYDARIRFGKEILPYIISNNTEGSAQSVSLNPSNISTSFFLKLLPLDGIEYTIDLTFSPDGSGKAVTKTYMHRIK